MEPAALSDPNNWEEVVRQQLECPVCFYLFTSPIYMCPRGHNVCHECREQLHHCPVCRLHGVPSNRNIALEALSEHLFNVPCKDQPNRRDIEDSHTTSLDYHKCLLCGFVESLPKLLQHIKCHPRNANKKLGHEMVITDNCGTYPYVFQCRTDKECFWVIYKYSPETMEFYFYMRHNGAKEEAGLFTVTWSISSGKEEIHLTKPPLHLYEKFVESDYVIVLPRRFCYFPTGEWNLKVKFFLKQNAPSKPGKDMQCGEAAVNIIPWKLIKLIACCCIINMISKIN